MPGVEDDVEVVDVDVDVVEVEVVVGIDVQVDVDVVDSGAPSMVTVYADPSIVTVV